MLELSSPRWADLDQAFGSAEDVPRLLAVLPTLDTDGERGELWFGLWATLCPEGRVFDASYAAAPHLLAITEHAPTSERARALHLVTQIEVTRSEGGGPPMPTDLLPAYAAAIERMPVLVAGCSHEPWTSDVAQVMAAALLTGKRQPALARVILNVAEGSD